MRVFEVNKVFCSKSINYCTVLIFFICLVLFVYYPVLSADYVWDDVTLFLERTTLSQPYLRWSALSTPVLAATSYFRPTVFFTFWSEFQLFGRSPFVSHLVNLFIHSFNIFLIYFICRTLQPKKIVISSALPAILYGMHPILIESVGWVSGRFDLLATMFGLLACSIPLKFPRDTVGRAFIVSSFIFLSLTSKEVGIVIPLVIFLLTYVTQPKHIGIIKVLTVSYRLWLCIFLTILFYFILRKLSLGMTYHRNIDMAYIGNEILLDILPLKALIFYFKQTLLPFYSISPQHPLVFIGNSYPDGVVSLGLFVGIFLFSFSLLFYFRSLFFWGIFSYLLALFPVLHIIPLNIAGSIGCDRFLTLPLALLLIGISPLFDKFFNLPVLIKAALSIFILCWLALSFATVRSVLPFWKNEQALWYWMYVSYPNFEDAKKNYFSVLLKEGKYNLLLSEINKIAFRDKKLSLHDQFLYAVVMINTGNPRGVPLLKKLADSSDAYNFDYTLGDSEFVNRYNLRKEHLGSIYYNYAQALLRFEGNSFDAERQNLKALNFYSTAEKTPLLIQRFTILLANRRVKEAESLLKDIQVLKYYRTNLLLKDSFILLGDFCRHHPELKDCSLQILVFWNEHQLPE